MVVGEFLLHNLDMEEWCLFSMTIELLSPKSQGPCVEVGMEMLNWSFVFQGPKKVGMLWREAGLSWREFLAEGQDVGSFVAEKV